MDINITDPMYYLEYDGYYSEGREDALVAVSVI